MTHPFQDLFDQIPDLPCKGHCGRDKHNTCCGPIGCTPTEASLLDQYDGMEAEWLTLEDGANVMDAHAMLSKHGHLNCPHLGMNGRCTAYEVRPLICRVWGVTQKLKCPWGCVPARWLSDADSLRLFAEAERRCRATSHPL